MTCCLPFKEKGILKTLVENLFQKLKEAMDEIEQNLYKNSIDPFSALIYCYYQKIPYDQWILQEKTRQIQKSLQNHIGKFHENVIGSFKGWESMKSDGIIDVKNSKQKIIAEIKNKFNTTKGNHKVKIYDDFLTLLGNDYKDYKAYLVEIIPKNGKRYCNTFRPPDNVMRKRRDENKKIMVIDGWTFYDLATNNKDALLNLYNSILDIAQELNEEYPIEYQLALRGVFDKTYYEKT